LTTTRRASTPSTRGPETKDRRMTNYTNYTVHLNLTTFEVNESAEQSLKPKQIASLPVADSSA
jgi:hypothetical protein